MQRPYTKSRRTICTLLRIRDLVIRCRRGSPNDHHNPSYHEAGDIMVMYAEHARSHGRVEEANKTSSTNEPALNTRRPRQRTIKPNEVRNRRINILRKGVSNQTECTPSPSSLITFVISQPSRHSITIAHLYMPVSEAPSVLTTPCNAPFL